MKNYEIIQIKGIKKIVQIPTPADATLRGKTRYYRVSFDQSPTSTTSTPSEIFQKHYCRYTGTPLTELIFRDSLGCNMMDESLKSDHTIVQLTMVFDKYARRYPRLTSIDSTTKGCF